MNVRISHKVGGGMARFYFFPNSQTIVERLEILKTIKLYLKKVKSPRFYLSLEEEKNSEEKEITFEELEKILQSDSSETFSFLTQLKREYVAPCFDKKYFFTYFSDGMYGNRGCIVNFRPMPAGTDTVILERYDALLKKCFPQNVYPSNTGVNNEAIFYNKDRQRFLKKDGLKECEPQYLPVLGSYLQLREREASHETTLMDVKSRIDKDSWSFLKNVTTTHIVLLVGGNILSIRGTIKTPSSTTRCVKGLDVPVHIFIALIQEKKEGESC